MAIVNRHMDYPFAKSEFERLLAEIDTLLLKPNITFREADPLAQKTGVYIKNLFASKEDDRKAYQRNYNRNEEVSRLDSTERLINCRELIRIILVDINQNITKHSDGEDIVHYDDEGKPLTLTQLIRDFTRLERTNRHVGQALMETSQLFEQTKGKLSHVNRKLSEAENEKEKLHREIKQLNQTSASNRGVLGEYQTSVKEIENQREADSEARRQRLRDDVQRLQSTIDSLNVERKILEDKIQSKERESTKEASMQSDLQKDGNNDQIVLNGRLTFVLKIVIFLFFGYIVYDFISQYELTVVLLSEGALLALLLITFTKPQDRLIQIITFVVAVLAVLASIILPPIINSN